LADDLPGARRDLLAALALRPADADLRASLMWLLIAARDGAGLNQAMSLWAHDAETSEVLWGPYAAANMSLNRQATALHWFRKAGFLRDDYLWLMSYAECLDANSQPDLAWRIRRHAWMELRTPAVLAALPPSQLNEMRDRLAALSGIFLSGDEGKRVIQALLRADVSTLSQPQPAEAATTDGKSLLERLSRVSEAALRQAPASAAILFEAGPGRRPQDDLRLSASVRELALAYAMNNDAAELARAWLASRFVTQMSKPVWAELALMLAADDRQKLNTWLGGIPDWLPMYDRIEAAQRAGRPALAQTLAFDQLAQLPHDEELHARLAGLTLNDGPGLRTEVTRITEGPLEIRQARVDATTRLSSGLKLSVGLTGRGQTSSNTALLPNTPARDDEATLSLRRTTDSGTLTLTAHARHAAANVQGLRLDYNLAPSPGLTLSGNVGVNQRASETPLLRVAAMRSGFDANASYNISRSEYLRGGFGWQQFRSQEQVVLGSGSSWNGEIGSHLRIEYPNLTLRAFVAGNSYRESGRNDPSLAPYLPLVTDPAALRIMPTGGVTYGLGVALGTVVEGTYTRAWRPFADLALMYNRVAGGSYNFSTGIAGSILGQDVMTLRFQRSSGTPQIPKGFQEFGLLYQWFY
jgi:hypothetical protein